MASMLCAAEIGSISSLSKSAATIGVVAAYNLAAEYQYRRNHECVNEFFGSFYRSASLWQNLNNFNFSAHRIFQAATMITIDQNGVVSQYSVK